MVEENLTTFVKKVMNLGGSVAIIIPENVADYEGIKEGDYVKVMLVKLPKKEE